MRVTRAAEDRLSFDGQALVANEVRGRGRSTALKAGTRVSRDLPRGPWASRVRPSDRAYRPRVLGARFVRWTAIGVTVGVVAVACGRGSTLCFPEADFDPGIDHGPDVALPTADSMTIAWWTEGDDTGKVEWGP